MLGLITSTWMSQKVSKRLVSKIAVNKVQETLHLRYLKFLVNFRAQHHEAHLDVPGRKLGGDRISGFFSTLIYPIYK